MEAELFIAIGVSSVLALLVWRVASRKKAARFEPASRAFRCARCGIQALHSTRTIEAAQRGLSRLFCNACHASWLKTRAARPDARRLPRTGPASGSGCLVVLGAAALVVFSGAVWWLRT